MLKVIKDNYLNGFQMQFANGWTVSVMFGKANYISDRGNDGQSADAEIAAWDENGNWYFFDDTNDTVKGWVTPNGVAEFIAMIAAKE